MNDVEKAFVQLLLKQNDDAATAAQRVLRDGSGDTRVKTLAQGEINEQKSENPELQKLLGSSAQNSAVINNAIRGKTGN